MLLAHHPEALAALRTPTPEDPWRVLVSGCLAAWPCGVDGTDYGMGGALRELLALPTLRALPFCPEAHSLGTPRTMPDLHGGDGVDVIAGRARVRDEHGADLTAEMIAGAQAMADFARSARVELAVLTDMSAACGTQVISDGCRLVPLRRYQKGVGVAAAMLLAAGIPVVSQRDFATVARLRARLDPAWTAPSGLVDHHEHPWTVANLPGPHPRA
ncbi:MAG: DUF523 domain-containing protein [Polyangiales bacterium]